MRVLWTSPQLDPIVDASLTILAPPALVVGQLREQELMPRQPSFRRICRTNVSLADDGHTGAHLSFIGFFEAARLAWLLTNPDFWEPPIQPIESTIFSFEKSDSPCKLKCFQVAIISHLYHSSSTAILLFG
jgi:hypothetical protein